MVEARVEFTHDLHRPRSDKTPYLFITFIRTLGDVLGGRNGSYLPEDLGELLELESSTCSTFLSQLA